ncbi:hypothetical protein LTR67_011082 [Exophiala xenobiotica]
MTCRGGWHPHAVVAPSGLMYDSANAQFTVSYNGVNVTYSVRSFVVLDDRPVRGAYEATTEGSQATFVDDSSSVSFTFDKSGNNQISVEFAYTNHFFTDVLTGTTYYIDDDQSVPGHLLSTRDHPVTFPVISGAKVNAGVATVGSDRFSVMVDAVNPEDGRLGALVNNNSFEINGNLYTITGNPKGRTIRRAELLATVSRPRILLRPTRLSSPTRMSCTRYFSKPQTRPRPSPRALWSTPVAASLL